jgi:hypothetical protein
VKDHRELAKTIAPEQWSEIELTVDAYARQFPMFALLSWVWRRSFIIPGRPRAA